ncbi:MAG: hypothetical protein ACXVMS_00125 [Flavisolibacter sp.]
MTFQHPHNNGKRNSYSGGARHQGPGGFDTNAYSFQGLDREGSCNTQAQYYGNDPVQVDIYGSRYDAKEDYHGGYNPNQRGASHTPARSIPPGNGRVMNENREGWETQ